MPTVLALHPMAGSAETCERRAEEALEQGQSARAAAWQKYVAGHVTP